MPFPENTTVVVVHGAWADGSSWKEVILPLGRQGLQVVAAPLPLNSLSDDIVALNRTIARTKGPVIVAGHAYAGAVIAAANEERIKALVYIAALAPDEGETVAQVFYRDEAHPQAPKLAPDKDGWIWMLEEGFSHAFAHHATADQIALCKAVQRPIALKCIQEPAPKPAWKSKPSWFLIAEEDRMFILRRNTSWQIECELLLIRLLWTIHLCSPRRTRSSRSSLLLRKKHSYSRHITIC